MRSTVRKSLPLILAGAVGLAAAAGVYWSAWQTVPKVRMVPVVVVTRPIGQTETIPTDALAVRPMPDDGLPPGAFDDPGGVVGKTTARPLVTGQILTAADLAPAPLRRGLASGEVGVAVEVPQEAGPALRPGDLVNLVAVPKPQPGGNVRSPAVLMAGKRIVALYDAAGGQVADRAASGVASVATAVASAGRVDASAGLPAYALLALTPEESLALRDAQRTADLYLDVAPWSMDPVKEP